MRHFDEISSLGLDACPRQTSSFQTKNSGQIIIKSSGNKKKSFELSFIVDIVS